MSSAGSQHDVVEAILARRSVRVGFDDREVPEALLRTITECALAAPSSKNARPWRLHVITSRGVLDSLAAAAEAADDGTYVPPDPLTGEPSPLFESSVRESAAVVRAAPAAIALENRGVYIRDTEWLASRGPETIARMLTAYGLEVMGLGAALENMWLAANALGVQAAFLGDLGIASPAARDLLGLEGDLVGVLALGYSEVAPYPRRDAPDSTQTDSPVVWH